MGKTKPVTIRLTNEEYKQLKQRAEASNLSISRYLAEKSLNTKISPMLQRSIYQQLAIIKDCIINNTGTQNDILQECDRLWQLLK